MCLRVFLAERRVPGTTTGSRPARGGSARPSRSSTSCATSPRTTTRWAAATSRASTSSGSATPTATGSSTTSTPTSPRPPPSCPDCPPSSRRAVRGRARDVRRARRPAAGDPGRGDPAHPGPRARPGEDAARSPVRCTVAGHDLAAPAPADRPLTGRLRPPAVGRRCRHGPQRVVVVGGGIAGLATAALLASRGHSVDLFEKNDELGGRVGSVERDGFRFDTGASWYLMPEVFEHFFSLLGTTADAELDLTVLDPSYRVFFEGHDRARRRPPRPRAQPGAVRVAGAGGRRPVRRLPQLGRGDLRRRAAPVPLQQLRLAVDVPAPRRRTPVRQARPAPDPLAGQPRRGAVLRQPAAPAARLPRGVPRLLAEPGAEHVPPDEPPRPRRPGALPAGRVHPADRGDRRRWPSGTARGCTPARRSPASSPGTAPAVAGPG